MTLLLDTHFLIWLVLGSKRLAAFPWLERHRPWGVSPISFLERGRRERGSDLATSLYRTAMTGLLDAAREVKDRGTFGYLDHSITTRS